MILDEIEPLLNGAELQTLTRLDDDWMAIIKSGDAIYRGSGASPEEAIQDAAEGHFVGFLLGVSHQPAVKLNLASLLPKKQVLVRRF